MQRKRGRQSRVTLVKYEEPYRELWRSLTPRERLRRAWNLRRLIPDIQKLHDEKLIPRI